jgi:peptidoglycan/LPS O-acetylase OafA/YrhL
MRQHENAFDLLRIIAASMVLWSHQHDLMGLPDAGVSLYRVSLGGLGVFIFFVISGYLNTLSVIRHQSILHFLLGRTLRIYPALIICTAFAVVLGACFAPDLASYFDHELLAFIGKDVTLLTGIKAGLSHAVFVGNAMPNALNGSLWTLPYEVRMYVVLAICFLALRFNPMLALFVSTAAVLFVGFSPLESIWLQFSALFIAGCFVAAVQKVTGLTAALFAALMLSLLFFVAGRELMILYLLLTAAVIAIGSVRLPYWLRPPVDLSYAIYLYAFPVQQVSARLTGNFWAALALAATATFGLAFLSALLIERPAQRMGPDLLRWLQEQILAAAGKRPAGSVSN